MTGSVYGRGIQCSLANHLMPLSIPPGGAGGTLTLSATNKLHVAIYRGSVLPPCHCGPPTVRIVTGHSQLHVYSWIWMARPRSHVSIRFLCSPGLGYGDSAPRGNRHLATVPPGVGGDSHVPEETAQGVGHNQEPRQGELSNKLVPHEKFCPGVAWPCLHFAPLESILHSQADQKPTLWSLAPCA